MEPRPDTSSSSSGRFRDQWSFLANPPHHAQPRSLPPSSYLPQSDRSSISPHQYYGTSGSRSSLPRNLTTASIGGRSNATVPSQPVLIRVHSADASAHLNPAPRPRRSVNMHKSNGLPAISEFSIQGILAAIQEDVETDINTISEILGRSRFVLADQHESQMPPQGEIRAVLNSLQEVEETDSSSERLASDDVLILREDASLVDGSRAGSAAYGLLERLQALPRNTRLTNDSPYARMPHSPSLPSSPTSPIRNHSSPAVLHSEHVDGPTTYEPQRASRQLLQSQSNDSGALRSTSAGVSETHLFAGANGVILDDPSLLAEPSQYLHMDGYEAADGSESNTGNNPRTIRERVQKLLYVSDPTGLTTWLQGQSPGQSTSGQNAEHHLRGLLSR